MEKLSSYKASKPYIAITIGPILRTMSLTSSPAALWASSYLFSYIAKNLRAQIIETFHTVDKEDSEEKFDMYEAFVSPYVSENNEILDREDGMGLLHDHLIFEKPPHFTMDRFRAIREAVLYAANTAFHIDDLEYLKKYVMISAVEFTAENPIMGSGKMLDSAELASTFMPKEKKNPILSFFTNTETDENGRQGRNEEIKAAGREMGISVEKWQLLDRDGNVKDLQTIASGGILYPTLKKKRYYAVVRSDGDNMGKLIGSLSRPEEFHVFSEACLTYCERVAQKVNEYNGMTVYAGGDDLLALLPCENDDGKTIFEFVRDANSIFHGVFLNEDQPIKKIFNEINDHIKAENKQSEKEKPKKPLDTPSLTWGITLCHCKYPLYEALEDSTSLLFGAKGKGYKNALNLRLIKHSGQTSAIYVKNDLLADENGTFFALLNDILGRSEKETQDNNEILLSCLHTFHEAKGVFQLANAENAEHLFQNMFDADAHAGNDFLHKSLPRLYVHHCLKADIYALDDEGNKVVLGETKEERKKEIPDAPEALHYLLRILNFFVEKAGERE